MKQERHFETKVGDGLQNAEVGKKKGRKWGRGGLADTWEAAEERGE